jgi:hypothetical protein
MYSTQISGPENPLETVLILEISFARPMSREVRSFWNRNTGMWILYGIGRIMLICHVVAHASKHHMAIYFDQKHRAWSFDKFEKLTDLLEDELPDSVFKSLR